VKRIMSIAATTSQLHHLITLDSEWCSREMITNQTFVDVVGGFEEGGYVPCFLCDVYITSHSQFEHDKRDI